MRKINLLAKIRKHYLQYKFCNTRSTFVFIFRSQIIAAVCLPDLVQESFFYLITYCVGYPMVTSHLVDLRK